MEKFDLKSMKFLIAVVVVCVIFVAFLPLAYLNLPEETDNNIPTVEMLSRNNSEPAAEVVAEPETSPRGQRFKKNNKNTNKEEPAVAENTEILKVDRVREEPVVDPYEKAMSLRKEQKYESAVYEYQQIAKSTDDLSEQARCYQEIAQTYASIKRYGTALSYAQKAYNTSPSSDREMLMARLYYKTGSIDKATEHVNAILKRDFVEE